MSFEGYSNSSAQLGGKTFIDSGTISMNVPSEAFKAYSKLFDPPVIYAEEIGFAVIRCDAKGPKEPFLVTVNGTTFVSADTLLAVEGVNRAL
jgi:hypothetical protein